MIGPLTDPAAHGGDPGDAFHLVIPSLPGFGFSSPVTEAGWDTTRTAKAWAELMRRLGYRSYGVQSGDIGAAASPEVGRVAPEQVVGGHVNGSIGTRLYGPDEAEQASLTDLERDRVARVGAFMQEEFGYISLQSTRPQTLAAALVDSPAGQLAWIMDKFREWTHPHDVGIRRYAEPEDTITHWVDVEDRGGPSPPSKSPNCSPPTSGPSSAPFNDPADETAAGRPWARRASR